MKFSDVLGAREGALGTNGLIIKLNLITIIQVHCVKNVQIRRFSWSVFYVLFVPNTGKYGPDKTPYSDTFHAVLILVKHHLSDGFNRNSVDTWHIEIINFGRFNKKNQTRELI